MGLYGPDFYDDAALIAEIQAYAKARRDLSLGDIAVIAGEGRRLEFAPKDRGRIDTELREMMYEARQRGLSIGGAGGAITVEIGA
jgi:hypothetical protein